MMTFESHGGGQIISREGMLSGFALRLVGTPAWKSIPDSNYPQISPQISSEMAPRARPLLRVLSGADEDTHSPCHGISPRSSSD